MNCSASSCDETVVIPRRQIIQATQYTLKRLVVSSESFPASYSCSLAKYKRRGPSPESHGFGCDSFESGYDQDPVDKEARYEREG